MDWRNLEALTDRIVIGTYSETVRHSPMLASGAADPDRPQQLIEAVLHAPNADGTVSIGNGMITTIATSESALVINRAEYPDLVVKQGDRFRAMDAQGTPLYAASRISGRFPSIIVVHLGPA